RVARTARAQIPGVGEMPAIDGLDRDVVVEEIGERVLELRERMAKPGLEHEPARHDALAVEEHRGSLAEHETEREAWCGYAAVIDGVGERDRELALAHRNRRGQRERAVEARILDGAHQRGDEIVEVDPRHPLLAIAEPSCEVDARELAEW